MNTFTAISVRKLFNAYRRNRKVGRVHTEGLKCNAGNVLRITKKGRRDYYTVNIDGKVLSFTGDSEILVRV